MQYWIIALPREDMEHCIQIGTFGLNRKHSMGRVRKGDKVVCYITKEHKIIALGVTLSDYYLDTERIFKASGIFPDRFQFKATLFPPNKEIDFKSMLDDLTFISNKYYWSVYLRSGIASISEADWRLIVHNSPITSFV